MEELVLAPGNKIRSARGGVIHVVQEGKDWDNLRPRLETAFPKNHSWPMFVHVARFTDGTNEARLIVRPQSLDEVDEVGEVAA